MMFQGALQPLVGVVVGLVAALDGALSVPPCRAVPGDAKGGYG